MHMKKKYIYIDYLKAIAITFVVIQHAFAYYVENGGLYTDFAQNMRNMSVYFNIPIFFICAGFVCHSKNVKTYYLERVKRILVPFITFALLKLIYSNFISSEYIHGSSFTSQLFSSFILGEVYWFCYTILLIYLLAPLMWKKNDEKGVTSIGVIIGLVCIIVSTTIDLLGLEILPYFQVVNAIRYYPLFLFGYVLGQHIEKYDNLEKTPRTILNIFCLVFTLTYFIVLLNDVNVLAIYPFRLITYITVFAVLLAITRKFPSNYLISLLSKYSLQIMFFDSFYKAILFLIVNRIISLTLWEIIPVATLDISLSVLTCLIISKIPYIKKLFGL